MTNLRLLTIGGYISYRALFGWLNPFSYVITILIPSLTQLAFFVYLGRTAHVADDAYYVAGNALVNGLHPTPSFDTPRNFAAGPRRLADDIDPACPEHALRVVASRDGFADRRPSVCTERGQQDC